MRATLFYHGTPQWKDNKNHRVYSQPFYVAPNGSLVTFELVASDNGNKTNSFIAKNIEPYRKNLSFKILFV